MKYGIIIPDGAADDPLEELGGLTPLQAADLPALDSLAVRGRLGTASTATDRRFPTESATLLSTLGYAPDVYRAGVGALTAHARGIRTGPDDQVFCCDLVTVIDGYLRDLTAGFISPTETAPLIEALNAAPAGERFRFHGCGGHRNICVWENAGPRPELRTTPPELVLNRPTRRHLPSGGDSRALYELILTAEAILREHDVNLVRQDLGENPANAIWVWGHGDLPKLPTFEQRYGVRGELITGSDVARGIGRLIGWEVPLVAGATGLPDTNLVEKGQAAVGALESHDLVCVHVQAPYTLAILGNVEERLRVLEAVDRLIVAPLLERLEAEPQWRMLVIPARSGSVTSTHDLAGHTLFLLAGTGIESNRGERFDETNAAEGELHHDRAHELMEYFLHR